MTRIDDNTTLLVLAVLYKDGSMDFFPATSKAEVERIIKELVDIFGEISDYTVGRYPLNADIYKINKENVLYH